MRRREKRLLQFAGLLVAAFVFLPNVGLWSLYRDRVFDNPPDAAAAAAAADGQGVGPQLQVRLKRRRHGVVITRMCVGK